MDEVKLVSTKTKEKNKENKKIKNKTTSPIQACGKFVEDEW